MTAVETFADMLDAGQTFGAFEGANLIGMASLMPQKRVQLRHRGEVGAVFVQPKAHGTGAADALLTELLRAGEALGIWQFELFVAEDNPRAIAFYTRHGFERIGRMPNATYGADGPVHDLIMVRTRATL